MPSPDSSLVASSDRARRTIEIGLRVVAIVALILALVRAAGWWPSASVPTTASPFVVSATAARAASRDSNASNVADVIRTLRSAQRDEQRVHPVHLRASEIPDATTRALLSAAQAAGIAVSWTDSTRNSALALSADALVDPRGGLALRVAAPQGASLAIRDTLGLIDSVRAQAGGASLRVGRVAGTLSANGVSGYASVQPPTRPMLRRVLLVARAGWEAKFTLAALEELGWSVDARFAITPRVSVTQGTPAQIDTAQYAAVVALDSTAVPIANALARFVQSGGGAIIAGEATTIASLQSIMPGRSGARQIGVPGGLVTTSPRVGLAIWPVSVGADAVLLERSTRGSTQVPAVAARRVGGGRVVQVGYDALWEWRMQGGEGSVTAHRDWWGRLLSSVAFAPMPVEADTSGVARTPLPGNAAPFADLVARIGTPTVMPANHTDANDTRRWDSWLFVLAAIALIGEWGSRRLRGAR